MYEISLLTVMCFSIVFALSLNLITGFCGQISLGHAAFLGIGAYTAALFTTGGGSFWLGLPLAVATAAVFGFIVGFASLRVRHDFLAITTMGVGFLFTGFVRQQEFLGGEEGIAGIPDPGLGQVAYMALCAGFAVATIGFSLYLKRSWMGRVFEAIATDEDTARTMGIDVDRHVLRGPRPPARRRARHPARRAEHPARHRDRRFRLRAGIRPRGVERHGGGGARRPLAGGRLSGIDGMSRTAPPRPFDAARGTPLYQQVKDYVRRAILTGAWPVDHRIPSENELVRMSGASRMTVHRALRELKADGWLRRERGQGTFVADTRTRLDGAPFQLEDRWVNPAVARDYLEVDLTRQTPNEYLMRATPLSDVEHRLEAVLPGPMEQELLGIDGRQPCLLLHRRTWSGGRIASRAWLTHPGDRFYLATRFTHEQRMSQRPRAERPL